jgi:hypothetical protein
MHDQRITYVEPVFLGPDFSESWSQVAREISLNGRKLTVGERGCALGHMKVKDAVIDSGCPWARVLEDDVELPDGWVQCLDQKLLPLGEESLSVLLLNTNPLLRLSPGVVKLKVKPSGANAFLISRASILNRRYKSLEAYEIADWPISFVRDKFFVLSGVVEDAGEISLVGKRPSSRTRFFLSTIVRLTLSPLICIYLKVSLSDYLRWSIFGPIIRDIKLRYLRSLAFYNGLISHA